MVKEEVRTFRECDGCGLRLPKPDVFPNYQLGVTIGIQEGDLDFCNGGCKMLYEAKQEKKGKVEDDSR